MPATSTIYFRNLDNVSRKQKKKKKKKKKNHSPLVRMTEKEELFSAATISINHAEFKS